MLTMLKLIILFLAIYRIDIALTESSSCSDESSSREETQTFSSSSSTASSSVKSSSATASSSVITSSYTKTKGEKIKCGKDQVYDTCPASCPPRTCKAKGLALPCVPPPQPGSPNCPPAKCRCDDNHYENDQGECVTEEQCPPKPLTCGFNEVYVPCPKPTCSNQSCDNIGKEFNCPFMPSNYTCIGECRCKQGYCKNKIGQCISESDCNTCGKNQVYDTCPASCPPRTCKTKDLVFPCPAPLKPGSPNCPPAKCRCLDGYYKNDQGECVTKEQCPQKPLNCGFNEVYVSCPVPSCYGQTCENIGKKFGCPVIPVNYTCKGECRCKQGYYKNGIGQCVSESECKQCGKNQVYDLCPSSCPPRTCATKDIAFKCKAPLTPGDPDCPAPKCRCANGYFSNDQGECVPKDECPTKTCGSNEVYISCPAPTCANQTCENIGKIFNCPLIPSNYTCKGDCRCKNGYYRNKIGECISEEDCKKCPGEYEYFSCDNACDNECDKLSIQSHANCPIVNKKCNPMCYCLEGYARDKNNKCIPISQCPPLKSCGFNEVYVPCPKPTCSNQTCENIGKIFFCPFMPSNYTCKGECRCKQGYYRNKIGQCISEEDCKKCPGEYEYFSCGNACDNECDKLSIQSHANCPIVNIQCNKMCYCLDGYARDGDNKCIPISQCPPECKENEEYSKCPNNECRAKTCDDLGYPLPCYQLDRNNTDCGKPGCICKPGFVTNNDGVCIPSTDCPSCGGDKNAITGCGTRCKTCSNYKEEDRFCILSCQLNGCDCKDGFVYDPSTDKCVLPEKCPPQCGANEVVSDCANSPCIRNCANKDLNLQCKPYPPGCKSGCVCADGYLRNDKRVCVPIDKCPPNNPECGENEELSDCSNQVCRAQKCSELGFPLACNQFPRNTTKCEKSVCVCKEGFLRNEEGVCVDSRQCPSCGGDKNAGPGCSNFCTQCSNYKDKARACAQFCLLNGCACKDGFIYDSEIRKCVLPEQCSPQCGANEVVSDCANSPCLRNCANKNLNLQCKTLFPGCKRGCVCADGYLRNNNGVCVPIDKCPSNNQECGENEELSDCSNQVCRAQKCSELGFPLACNQFPRNTTKCEKSVCVCKEGFLRNEEGVCVDSRQCPSCGGDKNAGPGCSNFCTQCSNYKDKARACPEFCLVNGCACKDGFIYDSEIRKCVLPEQCSPQCGANEVVFDCANSPCLRNCANKHLNLQCKTLFPGCKRGCVCADGYLRNNNGVCVPIDKCPPNNPQCGPFQEYSECANAGCDKRNCSQVNQPALCIDVIKGGCRGGCVCQRGYLFNTERKCVPENECPSKEICPKPYEYYDKCPPDNCPPRTCKVGEVFTLVACKSPSDPSKCKPDCVCDSGRYRNDEGECVTLKECPPRCSLNEVASDCATNICLPDCSEPKKNTYCKPNPANCKPGCVCAEGYLRNKNGVCVPENECPPNIECSENEEYSDCPNKRCTLKRCDELGFPLKCANTASNNTSCGPPGCVCKSGMVRNKDDKCVNIKECPSCGGDKNATLGCGSYCNRCSNYKDKNKKCPFGCIFNGCACLEGFVYDDISKKCVLPVDCPPSCGPNEVLSDCGNNGCLSTCAEPDKITYCDYDPSTCKPGCVCKEGYLKNANDVCVPRDKCTPSKEICKKSHEYYDKCPPDNCPPRTCEVGKVATLVPCKPPSDPSKCKPSCVCFPEYFRNSEGECVPLKECLECSENEEYSDCPDKRCTLKRCDELGFPLKCANTASNDTSCGPPGCVCKSGMVRNKDDKCININECPSCGGDKNATLGCGSYCNRCSNYKDKNKICPLACIYNGCACLEGFVYDDNSKKCVLPVDCPPSCGPNEVPSDCGNNGCLSTCAEPDKITYCDYDPSTCKPGCVCKKGWLRNKNGVCVPRDECTPKKDNSYCLLPPETGPCRASMPKYYYDPCKKDCVLFTYGGCRGNDNKFDTKDECLEKCSCYNE